MTVRDVRAYEITVRGFPPVLYSARSPAKARSRCWRDYQVYDDRCGFAEFLKLSSIRRAPEADCRHTRILVCGKPATQIIHPHRRDLFMYDGSDHVMSAHPSEVTAP